VYLKNPSLGGEYGGYEQIEDAATAETTLNLGNTSVNVYLFAMNQDCGGQLADDGTTVFDSKVDRRNVTNPAGTGPTNKARFSGPPGKITFKGTIIGVGFDWYHTTYFHQSRYLENNYPSLSYIASNNDLESPSGGGLVSSVSNVLDKAKVNSRHFEPQYLINDGTPVSDGSIGQGFNDAGDFDAVINDAVGGNGGNIFAGETWFSKYGSTTNTSTDVSPPIGATNGGDWFEISDNGKTFTMGVRNRRQGDFVRIITTTCSSDDHCPEPEPEPEP
jgi:hypothetical protein